MFILYTGMLLDIWNVKRVEYVIFWIVIRKLQKNIQISCFHLFHHVLLSGLEISTRMLYDWRVHKFCIVVHNVLGISKYVSLSERVVDCKMTYSSLRTVFSVMSCCKEVDNVEFCFDIKCWLLCFINVGSLFTHQ